MGKPKKRSIFSRVLLAILVNVVIGTALLLFVPGLPPYVRFESYKLKPPNLLKSNNILDKAELIYDGQFIGPESIAQRGNELFTGVKIGGVIRIKDGNIKTVVESFGSCDPPWDEEKCGRPLGMRFAKNGKLIVADAYHGIFSVDVDKGTYETLVSAKELIAGKPPLLIDDLDISSDGSIYWSDASTTGKLYNSVVEYFGGPTGRLLKYDPVGNSSQVLIDGLHFANGVQLSNGEDFILVAETMRARVWKYHLAGPKKSEKEIFLDGLPGLPDNIRPNGRGGFYISLVVARDGKTMTPGDTFGGLPLIRKLILRIQCLIHGIFDWLDVLARNEFINGAKHYIGQLGPLGDPDSYSKKVIVVEVDENGQVIGSLQTEKSEMKLVTEVSVGKEYTYFGSYSEDKLWRIRTKDLGR